MLGLFTIAKETEKTNCFSLSRRALQSKLLKNIENIIAFDLDLEKNCFSREFSSCLHVSIARVEFLRLEVCFAATT